MNNKIYKKILKMLKMFHFEAEYVLNINIEEFNFGEGIVIYYGINDPICIKVQQIDNINYNLRILNTDTGYIYNISIIDYSDKQILQTLAFWMGTKFRTKLN